MVIYFSMTHPNPQQLNLTGLVLQLQPWLKNDYHHLNTYINLIFCPASFPMDRTTQLSHEFYPSLRNRNTYLSPSIVLISSQRQLEEMDGKVYSDVTGCNANHGIMDASSYTNLIKRTANGTVLREEASNKW